MTRACAHTWERDATRDVGVEHLRFVCSACGLHGYKRLGELDAAVRPLSDAAQRRVAERRGEEIADARARRAVEDPGFFPQPNTAPICPGGLPRT